MMELLSVSFANPEVAYESYNSLNVDCKVTVWDNHYPGNKGYIKNLCKQMGFEYKSLGYNVGMYAAYNNLIRGAKEEVLILHDGDHYIRQDDFHTAMGGVMKDPTVAVCTVNNRIISRELNERGFSKETINGINVLKPHQVITCTCAAWRKTFLDSVGGLTGGHKYYGGNEIRMWNYFNDQNRYVVLEDYQDDKEFIEQFHDHLYTQYKILYAHRGLNMTFQEYIDTVPEKVDIEALLKSIFG